MYRMDIGNVLRNIEISIGHIQDVRFIFYRHEMDLCWSQFEDKYTMDIYLSSCEYLLGSVQLPPFFFRNLRLYCKKLVIHFFIQSIVHRWPLLSPIFRVAYESRVEKTGHLLRLSTNRSNFLLLHKTGSAGQPGRVPLIETNDSQREQRLENTACGVGLPISTFPSMS